MSLGSLALWLLNGSGQGIRKRSEGKGKENIGVYTLSARLWFWQWLGSFAHCLFQVIPFPQLQLPPQSCTYTCPVSPFRPRDASSTLLLAARYVIILCYLVPLTYSHLCPFILSSINTLNAPALFCQDSITKFNSLLKKHQPYMISVLLQSGALRIKWFCTKELAPLWSSPYLPPCRCSPWTPPERTENWFIICANPHW